MDMEQTNSRLYIIFTVDIHPIGGNQLFTAELSEYLCKRNWDVRIVHPGNKFGRCDISTLDKYLCGGNPCLWMYKPAELNQDILKVIVDNVINNLEIHIGNYTDIYIGSQNNHMTLWAEYFAKLLSARMICFDVTEVFRGPGFNYEEYIDYYKFKFYRNELYSLNIQKLFGEYLHIDDPEKYMLYVTEGKPIKNVDNDDINILSKMDFNIAYIGRSEKKYVPNIINEIALFASKHRDMTIQILMIGNAECRLKIIADKLLSLPNVKVYLLGNLSPIPKKVFEKIDVVIAGSGAALYSSREQAPVIVVDADNCKANGVLGYDCWDDEIIFHNEGNKQYIIHYLLEKIFVGDYKTKEKKLSELESPELTLYSLMEKFNFASRKKEYYDVEKRLGVRKRNITELGIHKNFNYERIQLSGKKMFNWSNKVVIFGAGNDGVRCNDWLNNINVIPYSFVDNDSTKWYTEIEGVEIYPFEDVNDETDLLFIISSKQYEDEMYNHLIYNEGIEDDRIVFFSDLIQYEKLLLIDVRDDKVSDK